MKTLEPQDLALAQNPEASSEALERLVSKYAEAATSYHVGAFHDLMRILAQNPSSPLGILSYVANCLMDLDGPELLKENPALPLLQMENPQEFAERMPRWVLDYLQRKAAEEAKIEAEILGLTEEK